MGRLLTVPEVAALLNTGERFVRRLVEERRITVVHLGRLVRIPESAVVAFVEAGTVRPEGADSSRPGRRLRVVA
jgi:excisionase family DNA binding protein